MRFSLKCGLALIGAILVLVLSGAVIAGNTGDGSENAEYNTLAAEDYFEAESVDDITEAASEDVADTYETEETVVEVAAGESASIYYRMKVVDTDWTDWIINGADMMFPDSVEKFEVNVDVSGLGVMISVYDSVKGWSGWSLGSYIYSEDVSISAIKIALAGELSSNYDVYYAVFASSEVWTDWVSNGEVASDLTGDAITGIKIYIKEKEVALEDATESESVEETEVETEEVVETTVAVVETEAVEESTETIEESTEVVVESTEVVETTTEAVEESTEAIEKSTEAIEAATEAEDIIEESEAVVEEVESTIEEVETEVAVKAEIEEVYEGTFHEKTEEDERDILLVEEEGAAYYDITQSVLKPICAVYDFPNTHKNKGNVKTDMISIAATQVGYHRTENTNTKYGVWYGYPSSAWCAMYVSWCADQAGVSEDIIKPFCRCATEATWFKGKNEWKNPAGYTPVEGDIIFFHYNGSRINHVGIVTGAKDGYVYCIEGNHSDSVDITRHKLTASYISGYGTPDYEEEEDIPKVKYSVHLQTLGWLNYVLEGNMAGTTGEYRRMEAIKIALSDNLGISGSIKYRVHVKSYGWMPWVNEDEVAGTTGEYRRMEAIEIVLTGDIAKYYDIYYRVHSQTYGWLDWAKNGQIAGTTGLYKRMEAIEIVLVKKGGKAPGSTKVPYHIGES